MIDIKIDRKSFPARGDAPPRLLFEDLRLRLAPRRTCALVGPSGIGKSSLLQMIAGLDRDFDGSIVGRPSRIGAVFQNARLLPWRTVQENLELVLDDPREAGTWLRRLGFETVAHVYPQRLSVGMARRVALARALCIRPGLLLLDEPFASLDEATSLEMQALLRKELSRLDATVLLVTHSREEAEALADRVVRLGGRPARIESDRMLAAEHSL